MKNYLLIASLIASTVACKGKDKKEVDPNQAPVLENFENIEKVLVNSDVSSSDLQNDTNAIFDNAECDSLTKTQLKDNVLTFDLSKYSFNKGGASYYVEDICSTTYSVKVPAGHYLKVTNPKEISYSARVSSPQGTNTQLLHRISLPNLYMVKEQHINNQSSYVAYLPNPTVEPVKTQPFEGSAAELKSNCYSTASIARIKLEIKLEITSPSEAQTEAKEFDLFAHNVAASLEYVPCGL
ncbi:MAG: hypothetical protein EOP04_06010 [Proteobacteria bacterium]|nr:MAG: hypothetical protein EOP04_06010 [Pseudomonadota bacterium]